jgi:Transcriptional regulator
MAWLLLRLGTAFRGNSVMSRILDSRKLLAFSTLARLGSFTFAARELHLTQSAVSHAIKSLEQDLACRLFDRLGRHVTLTAAGHQLLEYADKILADMRNARENLVALGQAHATPLTSSGAFQFSNHEVSSGIIATSRKSPSSTADASSFCSDSSPAAIAARAIDKKACG